MNKKKVFFALFGNPVSHSKSSLIHKFFLKKTKIKTHIYKKYLIKKNNFNNSVFSFFKKDGLGINVTLPFKREAFILSDILTDRAKWSGSVNVLKKLQDGKILGDNTDGIGLLHDLKRINFIKKKYTVLLIGAGGAARGALFSLLSFNCKVYIYNRTFSKGKDLEKEFFSFGFVRCIKFNKIKKFFFNLIINATSSGIIGECPCLPDKILLKNTFCYDMFYSNKITPFLSWCKKNKSVNLADGIGMLVSQAAYSFFLWHGIFPPIKDIISLLKKN